MDLAEKEITDTRPRMGRPAIGKFTAVRLSADTLSRIDAFVAPGKRAEFIREAVEQALARRENESELAATARDRGRDPHPDP